MEVYKRPFLDEFMKFCLERFEVGLWSSAQEQNVDLVLDCAFKGLKNRFLFVWDQKQSTDTGFKTLENKRKPLFLKELSKLHSYLANSSKGARFSESNTLLIDKDPVKSLCNPAHTGIFPDTYDPSNNNDNALDPKEELGKYLEGLANAEDDDVPTYVKANPFGQPAIGPDHPDWDFYSRVRRRLKN
uniref:Mitochondrial import inner membrane translocase subunit TIM50 n=1 Tax=Chenopodium quinoa TaxID=63459 RepID=A0A803MZP7_CHEQI